MNGAHSGRPSAVQQERSPKAPSTRHITNRWVGWQQPLHASRGWCFGARVRDARAAHAPIL